MYLIVKLDFIFVVDVSNGKMVMIDKSREDILS